MNNISNFKISVVVPVYNGKKYLRAAINSVVAQTFPPLELFIVDDGSTDDSLKVIEDIKADFPIHIIQQKNAGQSAARNHGARLAKGNYLALLDQDDIWYPRHLEKLAKLFSESMNLGPRCGLVYSNLDEIDEEGRLIRLSYLDYVYSVNTVSHPKKSMYDMLGKDLFILPSATLICKQAFDQVGGFDDRLSGYEDDDLFARLFAASWINVYTPESLSQWRVYGASTSFQPTRMDRSRMIYAKKLVESYPDQPYLSHYWTSHVIVPRFMRNVLDQYFLFLAQKNFEHCKNLTVQFKEYKEMLPKHAQKRWRRYAILNSPRLVYFASNNIYLNLPRFVRKLISKFMQRKIPPLYNL